MSLKSFLFTLAIFCGGYASNTLLDSAVKTRPRLTFISRHQPTRRMPMVTSFAAQRSRK